MIPEQLPRRKRMVLVAVLIGVLSGFALSGWLLQRIASPDASGLPTSLPAGSTAPEFTLVDLEGETVALSAYRGQVVLVNFWASWCVPCQEEMPALQAAYESLQDQGFVVLGVNLRDRERPGSEGDSEVRDFIRRFVIEYPVAIDRDGTVSRAYNVSVIPTSFLIDRHGQVREVRIGIWRPGELEALFKTVQRDSAQSYRSPSQ